MRPVDAATPEHHYDGRPACRNTFKETIMGAIRVHEFITLDGVIDNPSWSFEYPFDPEDGHRHRRHLGRLPGDPARADHLRAVRTRLVCAHR